MKSRLKSCEKTGNPGEIRTRGKGRKALKTQKKQGFFALAFLVRLTGFEPTTFGSGGQLVSSRFSLFLNWCVI